MPRTSGEKEKNAQEGDDRMCAVELMVRKLSDALADSTKLLEAGLRESREIAWASVFNSAISDSTWLKDKSFSPGRWAVGYGYLYVLYRVLNEMRPTSILDIGLGQTSKMIGQYAAAHPNVRHVIVEQSEEWMEFFRRSFELPPNSEIVRLDHKTTHFKTSWRVRAYKGFEEAMAGRSFDLISVDGPYSGDMTKYARIDVLSVCETILNPNFVLMLDDINRLPERNMFGVMKARLAKKKVGFSVGRYSGRNDFAVIASGCSKFAATL